MPRRKATRPAKRGPRQPATRGVSEIFHSKMSQAHSRRMHVAEVLVERFGTLPFLALNAIFFGAWIAANVGLVPGIAVFDPYPFVMLTTIVSLEAIFLSIIVLIAQNRASKIADVREQIDLQVNVQSEREITKILHILDNIQHRLGMKGHDPELAAMKKALDLEWIEDKVLEEMNGTEKGR
ncbi:DUF1003 domain-containing protein [Patescibacteria group bacterium]|nr:MAG: DUF1003 domain-containing protein [Patescibacteria group bacterium]